MPLALPPILRRLLPRLPLAWVLTMAFVIPMVGAVVLVSYWCYRNGQTVVDTLGHQLVAETNGRVSQEIRTYLQAPVMVNQANVNSVQRGRTNLQDDGALEGMLLDRLGQHDAVSAVLFASPKGRFRFIERSPELHLGAADPPNPDRVQIYRLDDQGRRQQQVATRTRLDVWGDRPWYQQAVTPGQPEWNLVFQDGSFDVLTLRASQPVYDPTSHQFLGVFATHVRLDYLSQFLRTLKISRSGRILIVDRHGTLIANSSNNPFYKNSSNTDSARLRTVEASEDGLTRSLRAYLPPSSNVPTESQILNFRYNNESYYGQATPLRNSYGLDWLIVTVVPKSHFMGTIQNQTQQMVLLSLLTLILALAIGQAATHLLMGHFAQPHWASRALAAGNLDYHLPTDSPHEELSSLAQTFNQMRDQLHQSFGHVETALEETEAKFATIFRKSPDPMAIATLAEEYILEVNESLTEFLGYARAEVIGRTAQELNLWNSPEAQDRYRDLLHQQGRVRNLEAQLRTQAGAIKTVLLSAEILTLEGQKQIIIGLRDISDRKAFEVALAQSEARYRVTINALPDLIIRMHRTGTYLDVKLTDAFPIIANSQSIGKNIHEMLPEVIARERMAVVQKVLQTGEMMMYEFPLQVQDQHLWQEVRIVPLTSDEVLMLIRDLSQRKQMEEALRQSEARFRELAETVQQGFFVFETKTSRYSYLNPACVALTGLPITSSSDDHPSAMGMYHWFNGIHPEDRDRVEAALQGEHQGENFDEEYRFIRPDGDVRWLRSRAFPLQDETGEVVRIVGTVEDVTDRRQTEEALRESEERFRQIAAYISQVFFVKSASTGQYLYISPAYEKIWGLTCESLYQKPDSWMEAVHPEDLNTVLLYLSLQAQGHSIYHEYRIIRPDGDIRWIFTEVFSIFNEAGDPSRYIGLAEDITARKQLEQSLRSQAEEERLLATITQNIRQSFDLEQILATTVQEVQQTLKADRALIFRLHPGRRGEVIQEAVIPGYPTMSEIGWQDEPLPDDCYRFYQKSIPRIVLDVAQDEQGAWLTQLMQHMAVKSKMVAPIVQTCGEEAMVWGLLIVHACSHYRPWQESEADFLQQIANQLAIAIDQANLYQQLQVELAERKQAEETLREREAMLRAIGDNLPKGYIYQKIHESGKEPTYTYISAGIERLLGLKPEDVLTNPQASRTIGFEEDLAQADHLVQESLEKLVPLELQMRHRKPEGGIGWSSIRATPRRLTDGQIVWDGIEVDITELKRTEAALRASEELFRRAFDHAPIGISLVSLSGQFLKVNACYCDLLGYSEAELLALTFQDITHPDDLAADLEGLQRVVTGEIRSFQIEKRYITKQGTFVPALVNIALIRDQDGQPLYSVGHVQDIRDRLKVERMKDEFISVVSHELRTPLTSIQGALDILKSGVYSDRPEKFNRMLEIAIDNSERLERLVNDILNLERLESGKIVSLQEFCSITDLMRQAVESVQTIADQSGISLTWDPLPGSLWADPDAIVQTLINLLSNAIKFSSPGDTVWLHAKRPPDTIIPLTRTTPKRPLSTSSSSPPCDYILFSIRDQGRGIPADKLETIFEAFQQVDVSDSRKKGGTGLGLAICKKYVQHHHGHIWAESVVGEGSTFYVALPL